MVNLVPRVACNIERCWLGVVPYGVCYVGRTSFSQRSVGEGFSTWLSRLPSEDIKPVVTWLRGCLLYTSPRGPNLPRKRLLRQQAVFTVETPSSPRNAAHFWEIACFSSVAAGRGGPPRI